MLEKPISDPLLGKLISLAGGCNIRTGPWIAGGAARRLWFGEPWERGDVDFWFSNQDQFDRARTQLHSFVSSSVLNDIDFSMHQSGPKNKAIHSTSNAITYRVLLSRVSTEDIASAQIIRTRWFGDLDEIFGYFDFTVCKFATDGNTVFAAPDAVKHAEERMLVYNQQEGTDTPRICPKRVIKYGLYGFTAERMVMKALLDRRTPEGRIEMDNAGNGADDDGY